MILNAYTLFDNKSLQYHPPYFASTHAAAVRALRDLANDRNTTVGRHPSDYILYCCGTYDDALGRLENHQPLQHVMDAVALVELQPSMPTLFDNLSAAAATPVAPIRDNGKA